MKRLITLLWGLLTLAFTHAEGFSVSPQLQVMLAPGNLQYLAVENRFRFAPEQFSIVGYDNNFVGKDNAHWQDLFGWATSGYDNTVNDPLAIHFAPWSWICELGAELDYELNQFGYGPSQNMPDRSLVGSSASYDWGQFCTIGNYAPGTWRSLTRDEWHYLLSLRPNAQSLCAYTSVNQVKGILLWPDGATPSPVHEQLTLSEWRSLEKQGCAFLPMAGTRYHRTTTDVGQMAGYWTSTGHNQASAYFVGIYADYVALSTELYGRHTGRSVRLARNMPVPAAPVPSGLRYEDATHFRMINQAFGGETLTPYTRMTTSIQDSVIPAFWDLEKCSAGLAIRFRTNSKRVGARYRLLNDFHMSHMADTGTKGTDLYIYGKDNKWHYVATGKPTRDTLQDITYIENMDGEMHEFMLYLPLYDGIRWLEIGVDQDALLEQPKVNSPRQEKRVICYGPSTMQGGCASRTGMAGTSILQRRLNAEFVNLATSGVGRIWMPVARAMAAIPGHIDAFVLELLPNSTQEMVDSVAYDFVKTLHTAHPEALILLLENETYTYTHYDQEKKTLIPDKNAALRRAYERLRKEDKRNLVYLDGKPLTGPDEEGTVDGTHQTDLGYWAYADYLAPYLRKVLK